MRRQIFATALIILLTGCETTRHYPRTQIDSVLFGPAAMRIHPIFTKVKDWTGDDRSDGIEVLIELQDQFGDPTKASGRVIFELFNYRMADPDPRGERVINPWIGDLSSLDAQRERWNRTSRTYGFQLADPDIRDDRTYVLTATFELSGGGRFFDRIILEPKEIPATMPSTTNASTNPSTEPSTEPSTMPTSAPATTRAATTQPSQ